MQDLNDKVTGNTLSAAEWNEVPSELQNVIAALGIAFSSGDLNQLGKGITGYAAAGHFYTDGGAANAYSLTAVGGKQGLHALSANTDGALVRFRPANNSTLAAPTVNVNGLGAKTITREDLAVLSSGDISTTRDAILRYRFSSDTFLLLNASLPADANPVAARGYIAGFSLSRDAGDPGNDILFGTGICRDNADTLTIRRTTTIVKQIDATWAEGTNLGGRAPTVALAANTWYHCFVIRKASDGTLDAGFDTSLIAANLLTVLGGAYTTFRRVGSIRTDGASAILNFVHAHDGRTFYWASPPLDVDTTIGTAESLVNVSSLPAALSHVIGIFNMHCATSGAAVYARQGGVDQAASDTLAPLATIRGIATAQVRIRGIPGTPQQIALRSNTAATPVRLAVVGWEDHRDGEIPA